MHARLFAVIALVLAGCGDGTASGRDGPGDTAARPDGGGAEGGAGDAGPGDGSSVGDAGPADGAGGSDANLPDAGSGRAFPDTTSRIAILADQLPSLTAAQQQFVVDHYVGTQKLTLNLSQPLRALKPDFLVLHYHLAMWQSAPGVSFILDGTTWDNDYPDVTTHESSFWHDASGDRVPSSSDGKLLMNVADPGFRAYWAQSLAAQVAAGDYDAIFLDSASPALLQGEAAGGDPRLAGTAVRDTPFAELGGATWIAAWEGWIAELDAALRAPGIPLIPNTGAFITTWDDTDYSLTAGIFAEGFAQPSFGAVDWKASTNQILALVRADRIVILQSYLGGIDDLALRRYFLANYLLVKGEHTYLDYFAGGPLEWYPEWDLDLGAPTSTTPMSVDDLLYQGVYRRDYERGLVLVNPGASPVTVTLPGTRRRVEPQGGGAVSAAGVPEPVGTIGTSNVQSLTVPANGAEILLTP